MKQKTRILLIIAGFLVTSCNLRYGHVPKVKSNKTHLTEKRHKPVKKLAPATLENKSINFPVTEQAAELYPIKIKRFKHEIAVDTPEYPQKSDTARTVIKPPLKKKDVKLNDTNFYPVFNLVLIILLFVLLLLVTGLAGALIFELLFFFVVDFFPILIPIILLTAIMLSYLVFTWIRNRIKKYQKIKTSYNGTSYTEEEIKKMPREIRHRHAVNNLLATLILLVLTIPLLLFPPFVLLTVLFALAACYFFMKFLFTL